MSVQQTIDIIGVPSDLGANMRGSDMGPAALRIAELKRKIEIQGYKVNDLGNIDVPVRDALPKEIHDEKFLSPLSKICSDLCEKTYESVKQGHFPLTIGGDHSIAVGSISGVAKHFREKNEKIGLVWIDAHADINTPDSSPSGNIHGMPLATILGSGHPSLVEIGGPGAKVSPANVALIGIRTIDDHEKAELKRSGIHYYSMRDVDERRMYPIMKEAIEFVSEGTSGIHVSFDIDGIDPQYTPGVSTPVSGGLTFRESHLLLEMLYETNKMCSLDFVELNPFTDVGAQSANVTVDLILSALGKSIV